MKRWERVLRQILYLFYEENIRFMNQKSVAESCGVSLGTVNPVMQKLDRIGAIEKKPLGFRVIDVGRILLFWANNRDLDEDVVSRISTSTTIDKIEKNVPAGSLLTAYSAFKIKFGETVERYREVHVYGDAVEIKKKFEAHHGTNTIVVLKQDEHLSKISGKGVVPVGQVYVDLWQLGVPAKTFVDYLNAKLKVIEMGTLKGVIHRTRERT